MNYPGRFLTIEGTEGAGKSTCLAEVERYLMQAGKTVKLTREPGGTALGEALRGVLLDRQYTGMASDAELLMMFAARAEHLHKVIIPSLAAGHWVVSDRFTEATYAYQGGGRQIPQERIAQLENWLQATLRPQRVLLMDIPVAIGLARAAQRSQPDRFEQERLDFFARVRTAYLAQAAQAPARFRVIDASRSRQQVQASIQACLDELLAEKDDEQ